MVDKWRPALKSLGMKMRTGDGGSTDPENSDNDDCDPDFVPDHFDFVGENSFLSLALPISVQNTDTSDANAKDLPDDVDSTYSTAASIDLSSVHTTTYD